MAEVPETEHDLEKQCRICFDGEDESLGRLIRPCLCRGSISVSHFCITYLSTLTCIYFQYVHVTCLKRWRNTSFANNSFYRCPQCHYHYHFARTKAVGLATNPSERDPPSPVVIQTTDIINNSSSRSWHHDFFPVHYPRHVFILSHNLFHEFPRRFFFLWIILLIHFAN